MNGRGYADLTMRSRILIAATMAATLLVASLAAAPAPAKQAGISGGAPQVRDVVLAGPPSAAASRKAAKAGGHRYPVGDPQGRTVMIEVTLACQSDPVGCPDKDPAALADFLGTLVHGDEIRSLSVLVAHPSEMNIHCGDAAALACYYSDRGQIVIPGRDFLATDGANRPFVIAHEYGHHIANHRRNPPFEPTVYYGTKRWGTHERICPGTAAGRYFPGNQGSRYYQNPGEAFAEAYAFSRFPNLGVTWNWDETLRPDAGAYRAIRTDVRRPWQRRTLIVRTGAVGMQRHAGTQKIATPLDGDVSLRLRGEPGAQLDLVVFNGRGRLLARAEHFGANERIQLHACGQRSLHVRIRRPGRHAGGEFRLVARRP